MQSEPRQLSIIYEVHKWNIESGCYARVKYAINCYWVRRVVEFGVVDISGFGDINQIRLSI